MPLAHAWAIEVDGEASGGIGLTPGTGERAVGTDFGYWLGRSHWGRAIMTRVVRVCAPWAMDTHALHRLQACVFDFNHASVRVLEHNGFVEEGRMRRAVCKDGVLHDLRLFARLRCEHLSSQE
ncbi:MAG: GNAT family protein [Pseudoxanthomonas suwonensis]|nr:GNAT family protein [Pseudoxanthomonas suwonensis]